MGSSCFKKLKLMVERKKARKAFMEYITKNPKGNQSICTMPPLMVEVDGEMVVDPSLNLDNKGILQTAPIEEITL